MMNKKEIFKKVGGILTELNEQYDYLSKNPENLNDLELELFSANANFLSDHITILLKLSSNEPVKPAEKPAVAQPVDIVKPENTPEATQTREEPVPEDKPEETKEEVSPDWKSGLEKDHGFKFDFEAEEEESLDDKDDADSESQVEPESEAEEDSEEDEKAEEKEEETVEEAVEEEQEPDAAHEETTQAKTEEELPAKPEQEPVKEPAVAEDETVVKEVVISERTVAIPVEQPVKDSPQPTLNDLLSKSVTQQTVSSQFNTRQVKDLKSMINLNDKLLFVRDLFNGYSLAYSEAIELLNRFDSFEAADNFLKQNYSSKNNWGNKPEVADKFYEILNRRFSK